MTTLDGLEGRRQDVVGQWGRRAFLAVLMIGVVAAMAGFLGVRSSTVRASDDGWKLSLEHASVARAGLDVPFTVTVRHQGGFGEQVTLALTGTYLDIYETQGFNPEPSESRRDGTTLYLTFDAPAEGATFVVTYDAYVQPSAQTGRQGILAVLADGREVAAVDVHTLVLP